MNKIYKVVWSKVKHCYVVTSELAKRQTKGCGARSLRTATVSLGVAAALLCTGAVLPIFCESVAEASSEDVSNKTVVVPSDTYPAATSANKKVFGGLARGSKQSNEIYGGYSSVITDSTKSNQVTIGKITMAQAAGGWSTNGSSIGNSVTVNG